MPRSPHDSVVVLALCVAAAAACQAFLGFDSGDGGAAADAGLDGDVARDSGADAVDRFDAPSGCKGTGGPVGVPVGDSGYCIDRTEVTVGHYRAFLAAREGDTSGQPAHCTWNTSFAPKYGVPGSELDEVPVTWVDFCDAVAFCSWAGKRVCGAIDGAPLVPGEADQASRGQWFRACSRNDDGLHAYPVGNDYKAGVCVGADSFDGGSGAPQPVGSALRCEGGYPGIFDMSGNVREWEDACEPGDASADPAMRRCRNRGGAFYDLGGALTCKDDDVTLEVTDTNVGIGIRCCSD